MDTTPGSYWPPTRSSPEACLRPETDVLSAVAHEIAHARHRHDRRRPPGGWPAPSGGDLGRRARSLVGNSEGIGAEPEGRSETPKNLSSSPTPEFTPTFAAHGGCPPWRRDRGDDRVTR